MFYNYEIKNNGFEDILYLYLSMKYEFSKELINNNEGDIGRRTKNFINNNNINFNGNKVFLIIDGIVVKTIDLANEILDNNNSLTFSSNTYLVNICLEDNSLCEVTLKEYLVSILLSKYLDNIHDEVYKAICVLYTTYAYRMMKEKNFIYSNNKFAVYKPSSYYKTYINNYDYVIKRLYSIINEVDCVFLSYKGMYILPFIHYSNNGKTLNHAKYPYLTSKKSLWDLSSPYYININDFTYKEINKLLGINVNYTSDIIIYNKNNNKNILWGDKLLSSEEVKLSLSLKSNDIYIIMYKSFIRIITRGWGNFLGLSIYGANEIAKDGVKYYNILKYYFPKTKLYKYIKKELS